MRFSVIWERSILFISRISLIRLNRCLDEMDIFCRQSATLSRSPIWAIARAVMPITAFMGVRISWLMVERKSLFARFASSARARASSSAFSDFLSAVSVSVTSALTRPTVE